MEKSGSRIESAKDFVRDLLLKFPADGELMWLSEASLGQGNVELEFSVIFFGKNNRGTILYFKALCHFCSSGLCSIRILGKTEDYPLRASIFFKDEEGVRIYEIHEPQGLSKQGLYPLNFS